MKAQFKTVDDAKDVQMAPLHALKKQRQDLSDRAAGLIAARNRLAGAEEAEREAVAAMTEWASKGAAGDPPAPDMVQHRELGERLGASQAVAAAAKGASGGIQDELASIHTELSDCVAGFREKRRLH